MIEIYTEQQASEFLFKGMPPQKALQKLKRARYEKKIDCRKDGHYICYTDKDLNNYLEGIKQCRTNATHSESIGSPKEKIDKCGTSLTMMPLQDKQSLKLLAQQTFGKPKQ